MYCINYLRYLEILGPADVVLAFSDTCRTFQIKKWLDLYNRIPFLFSHIYMTIVFLFKLFSWSRERKEIKMWPKFERLEHPPKGLPDGTETIRGITTTVKPLHDRGSRFCESSIEGSLARISRWLRLWVIGCLAFYWLYLGTGISLFTWPIFIHRLWDPIHKNFLSTIFPCDIYAQYSMSLARQT